MLFDLNSWDTQPGGGGFGSGPDGRSHTMVVHRDDAEYLGRESFLGRWLFSRRLIVVALVFVLAIGLGVGGWWFTTGRYTSIPTVTRDTVAEATAALTHNGFRAATGPQEHSNTVAAGLVAGTSPAGRALKGSTITIIVSAGPFTSVVPAVRGETLAAAKSALAAVHLSTEVVQVGSTLPKGTVTGTTPKAGITWQQTRPVTILVAGGPPMPNFVGMQKAAAASLAATDQLTVNYATGTSSNEPPGVIIRQSVRKGTIMTPGETVTLTLSTGPPGVQLPDVIGEGIQAAKVTLEELGFKVAVQGEDFFGTVEDETPTPGGQTVPYGSIITLTVDAFGGLGGGNGGGNGGGGNGGGGGGIIGGL